MIYLRSFVLTISFLFFGIGTSIVNFIVLPLIKLFASKENYINLSSNIIHCLWHFFIRYMEFVRLIKNPEAIKNTKNKVIVATHPSFIDVMVFLAFVPRTTCFVKNAIAKNLIWKNIVKSIFILNDLPIDDVKAETKKYLDKGFNIIVFPSGTRHWNDEKPKVKKGAATIALNAGKDILPVKISCSEKFLFVNQPFYYAGKNIVEYTLEVCDLIGIDNFQDESEIVNKMNITKEIAKKLYE